MRQNGKEKPLGQHRTIAASAFAGYFSPIHRFEKFEVHKVFQKFPNLNLEQNPSLTALAIESEVPWTCHQRIFRHPRLRI